MNITKTHIDFKQFKNIPKHVAIITDGNGRWATKRDLPRSFGHKAGVKPIKDITELCAEVGVNYLTWYIFSTENWKRNREEVDFLMNLFIEFFKSWRKDIVKRGIRFNHIGIVENLPDDLKHEIELTKELTKSNSLMTVNIALNYGGRLEITNAVRLIAKNVEKGTLDVNKINEETINRYLYTSNQSDIDILIRTSGEQRISNFLLWQVSNAKIWTTPVLWPDFNRNHLWDAFNVFNADIC